MVQPRFSISSGAKLEVHHSDLSSGFPILDGPDDFGVFVVRMGNDENRITFDFMKRLHDCLDTVESHAGPTACVVSGKGKFFSNGFSMEALVAQPEQLLLTWHKVLSRLISFPLPLIAAINGHAFAGGAMLAFACDYRIMNSTRGYLCVNEIDLNLPLTPGMCAVIRAKIDRSLWTDLMLRGRRFDGPTARSLRMVHDLALSEAEVLPAALELAKALAPKGENRTTYG
eukprot:GHVT01072371.1.p1 GENE.GHVT01072371.1~~GHVT01072371.1.p1  ORF type:complete len:228 (+),score=27.40 GHVT01072371.1:327-1010(+)